MARVADTSARFTNSNSTARDVAILLLRIVLGVLILMHGIAKLNSGPGAVLDTVVKAGLPAAIAYLVYVGEVLAPVLLILGVWTRLAALVVAINMVFAVVLVHTGQLLSLAKTGGYALELQAIYLTVAMAIALLGAGRFSVGGNSGHCN